MELTEDNKLVWPKQNVVGVYRPWPSKYGSALSAIVFIPEHGGYFMIWKYEKSNNSLTLTPIAPTGPMADKKTIWKRK